MNFEEMIEARNAQKTTKVRMPYGFFYKRQIEGKYSNFVEFHDELVDNIFFTNSVKHECEFLAGFKHKAQLHFTPNEGDDVIYAIAIEVGNYLTLGQLLNDDPSVVARNEFLKKVLKEILDITVSLNDENVYHVCFAPRIFLSVRPTMPFACFVMDPSIARWIRMCSTKVSKTLLPRRCSMAARSTAAPMSIH